MNNNNNIPNGPMDVAGEYTPITKQKVPQVESNRWNQMSTAELYDQKAILDSRYIMAAQIGNASLMQQIQIGVSHLTALINSKADKDISLI
jgi:hypothetical protein